MINTLKCAAALGVVTASAFFAAAAPAFCQQPTDAQRNAIRSSCRADYQAHCASVPPGGMESLQCLQKNMSSLSSSCQTAVRAVEAPAAARTEAAPAATKTEAAPAASKAEPEPAKPVAESAAPKPATAPAPAEQPSGAQVAAIRSACRSDYQKTCAGVPTGGAAALNCLETNKSKLSAGCLHAVNAASGADSAPAAPAAEPAATALTLRPLRPREELFVLRSACGGDVRALCGGVAVGGGRIVQCLASQAASLSPACRGVLAEFAAR